MNEVINNIKEEVKDVEKKTKNKLHELKEKLEHFKHKDGETPKTEAAPPTPGSSVM